LAYHFVPLPAQCLKCYTCKEPTDVSECITISNCSQTDTACKTTVWSVDSGYPFFGNITVSKSCAEKCVPSDPDGIGESHPNSCCYTDLCNTGRELSCPAGGTFRPFRKMLLQSTP
uniref:Snake toxin/toxin-like domain-containing protein n=1 Tax=Pelusios castaneus TaxID=367368 RepID=A0A8C8RGC8_9SAUR